jgi:hypothetical protein
MAGIAFAIRESKFFSIKVRRWFTLEKTVFQFPNVDPIPLPAPVWLFKLLHIVTLTLHFVAVQLLIGGLSLATLWNFLGKRNNDARDASASIIRKLPTITTYVINFGVPPLLFAQVLYGRALYSSSVLIGLYWFSVVVVLTLLYFLLYKAADRANEGKAFWGYSLASFLGVIYIAKVFSTNMTLMLRPDSWQSIYQASNGLGNVLPTGDPTTVPRLLFMIIGSLGLGGIAVGLFGSFGNDSETAKAYLIKWGARVAVVFSAAQIGLGYWVFKTQPAAVQSELLEHSLFSLGAYGWVIFAALTTIASCAFLLAGATRARLVGTIAFAIGFLSTAMAVLARDGIRDITLAHLGFDVWDRAVASNWSVVLLFLGLFVGGLALIAVLLIAVSRSARRLAQQQQQPVITPRGDIFGELR